MKLPIGVWVLLVIVAFGLSYANSSTQGVAWVLSNGIWYLALPAIPLLVVVLIGRLMKVTPSWKTRQWIYLVSFGIVAISLGSYIFVVKPVEEYNTVYERCMREAHAEEKMKSFNIDAYCVCAAKRFVEGKRQGVKIDSLWVAEATRPCGVMSLNKPEER